MSLFKICYQNNYGQVTMETARKIATFGGIAKFRLRNREEEGQQLKIEVNSACLSRNKEVQNAGFW